MLNTLFVAAEISSLAVWLYFWMARAEWRDRAAQQGGIASSPPYDLPRQAAIFLTLLFAWARYVLFGIERGFDEFHTVIIAAMLLCLGIIGARLIERIRER